MAAKPFLWKFYLTVFHRVTGRFFSVCLSFSIGVRSDPYLVTLAVTARAWGHTHSQKDEEIKEKRKKWALAVFTDILGITCWKMSRCIDRHAHTQEQHADQVTGKRNVKHFPQLINHRRSCRYKHTVPQHLGSHSEQRHRRACSNMAETCIMSDPNTPTAVIAGTQDVLAEPSEWRPAILNLWTAAPSSGPQRQWRRGVVEGFQFYKAFLHIWL